MFHDWKNGPKCTKLIRNLQCRLKILKSKRSYKTKQLRDKISQLLHHGLEHHAFNKAEKLFKYEHEVMIYDLLDTFCKFMINFSYITKYNDFPNVIDQVVSTLIFSSSRLRDLPELVQIRKLFQKLYGERFANVALDLLPGNLVNQQIIDCMSIISEPVSREMKFRLMNEIARNCLNSRPLLIDHPVEESSHEGNDTSEDETWSLDIEDEDSSSESQSCSKQSVYPSCSISTSSTFSDNVESLIVKKAERELEFDFSDCEFINLVPRTSAIPFEDQIEDVEEIGFSQAGESSSQDSAAFSYDIIYSDGIEEYESVVKVEESIQDHRVFKFPLTSMSRREPRKRLISVENACMIDSESAISYGVDCCESDNRNYVNEQLKSKKSDKCSEQNPCDLCKSGVNYLLYQYLMSLSQEEKEEFIKDELICLRASSMPPERLGKVENSGDVYHKEHCTKKDVKRESKRKPRKRSISMVKGCLTDSQSSIYYGVHSYEFSPNKYQINKEAERKMFDKCSEENPCYLCKTDGVDDLVYKYLQSLSPEGKEEFIQDGLICMRALSMPPDPERLERYDFMDSISCKSRGLRKRSISVEKGWMLDSESDIYYGVESYETSQNKTHVNEGSEGKKSDECSSKNPCYLCNSEEVDYLIYQSCESLSPEEKEEIIKDGLLRMRVLGMPPESLAKYDSLESISSISGSKSFPIMASACYVHPQLLDYDDLTTRFFALKKAYLECNEGVM